MPITMSRGVLIGLAPVGSTTGPALLLPFIAAAIIVFMWVAVGISHHQKAVRTGTTFRGIVASGRRGKETRQRLGVPFGAMTGWAQHRAFVKDRRSSDSTRDERERLAALSLTLAGAARHGGAFSYDPDFVQAAVNIMPLSRRAIFAALLCERLVELYASKPALRKFHSEAFLRKNVNKLWAISAGKSVMGPFRFNAIIASRPKYVEGTDLSLVYEQYAYVALTAAGADQRLRAKTKEIAVAPIFIELADLLVHVFTEARPELQVESIDGGPRHSLHCLAVATLHSDLAAALAASEAELAGARGRLTDELPGWISEWSCRVSTLTTAE